jgi:hypothetical protein
LTGSIAARLSQVGAGRIFCRTGAFAYLHATPRHFTPVEISGWLW